MFPKFSVSAQAAARSAARRLLAPATAQPSTLCGQPQRMFHTAGVLNFRIKHTEDVSDTTIKAKSGKWESRRYWLRRDGFGHSLHHTIIYAGTSTLIHYKNHIELVFIAKGSGEIELTDTGEVHKLKAGSCYALDKHDRHYLRADPHNDMECVCTFNPPIDGAEDHNEDGVYPVIDDKGVRY